MFPLYPIISFPVVCSRKTGCSGAIHVRIPENTTVVDAYAFSNDDNLQVVDIPNTVTTIEPFAFHACKVLSVVHLSTSIISISIGTFSDCISLKVFYSFTGNCCAIVK